jgi:Cu+-exporting ATPase
MIERALHAPAPGEPSAPPRYTSRIHRDDCAGSLAHLLALRGIPGVLDVSVNLAAEKATVECLPGEGSYGELERAVEGAGYGVVLGEKGPGGGGAEEVREREYRGLRVRFLVAAVLTGLILLGSLPMMVGFMPPVPEGWLNLALLALATPVQFWAGWHFYGGRGALSSTGRPT